MSEDLGEQLGYLELMLGNLMDKLPIEDLVEDRVGPVGTGTISLRRYYIEYHTPDEDEFADDEEPYDYFMLVSAICCLDLLNGVLYESEETDWDELGKTFEEAVQALANHEWLK